jgi:putative oxidoreductase
MSELNKMNSGKDQPFITQIFFGRLNISSDWANLALLFLRFYAGFTIMMAGLDKLPLTDWMTEQVESMGFPFPVFFAWFASFSEFAFGALLVLGLLTRISGIFLAIIMGVASFGFQGVLPLVDMHIAQHFFWIFILYSFLGAGKFSIDYWLLRKLFKSPLSQTLIALVSFLILLFIGLFREYNYEIPVEEEEVQISSFNIPGSFNNWDPSSNSMEQVKEDTYVLIRNFDEAGYIEFKITTNGTWDINLGEEDQSQLGFPVKGTAELDNGGNTENIKAFIPESGSYRFLFNSETYEYSLDSLNTQ